MLLSVINLKGGVGKSTLACALSVCAGEDGQKVALIDVDPQGTTRDWHALRMRKQTGQPLLLSGSNVQEALKTAEAEEVDWVFIDTQKGSPRRIPSEVIDAFPLVDVDKLQHREAES